jgi:glycosyltransferase involved in cell wall biosynthesis
VDTDFFTPGDSKDDYYLTISRLGPYKRIDLIVQAFAHLPDRRLVVIGEGPERKKIEALAGANVEMHGFLPDEAVRTHMRRARAFVFAAWEDFGITPVEAQACGTPVIAFGRGGALETVTDGVSGIFFNENTPQSLADAIRRFEALENRLDPDLIWQNALRFGKLRFQEEMLRLVEQHRPQRP